MAKTELQEVTEKTLRSGGMLAKLYFDMASEKQDELQPLMTQLINERLLKTPGVVYGFGSIDDPIKLEKENVYSTNAIVTVLFKDLGALVNVVFNFAPIGIEIMQPEGNYTIKINDLNAIMVSLSQISAEYSKYILTRVMTPEDMEKIQKDMKSREEQGKRLMDKKHSEEKQS